jgi:hypothetical protein
MDLNQMKKTYLTNIPESMSDYGLCKTFYVRYESIHLKHIFTEIFVRKTIVIDNLLNQIGLDLFQYMEIMTVRLRHIFCVKRDYQNLISDIIKQDRNHFFPTLDLYKGLNNIIVLDFDGVCTSKKFCEYLYQLCYEKEKIIICSANPTINEVWFEQHNLPLPYKIYACRGKRAKMKQLLEIQKRYDNIFFVDDEKEYLDLAWILGIKTFQYARGKIDYYSLKTR